MKVQTIFSLRIYSVFSGQLKLFRCSSGDMGDFKRAEKGRKLSMVGDLAEFQLRQERGRKLSIIGEQFEFKMHGNI